MCGGSQIYSTAWEEVVYDLARPVIKYTEINLKLNQYVKSNKGNSLLTVKVYRNETPGDPNLFNLCLDVQRGEKQMNSV